jgi:hypothetical protein
VLRQIEHVLGVDTDTYIEVSKDELENIALESNRTIDIDEFVPKSDIDPRYLIRPYYLIPDGKVGHDAFTVIRETIHSMDMVAIEPRAHHRAGAIRKRVDGDASQVFLRSPGREGIFRRHPGREGHLVPLHDVVVGNLLAGVGVHLRVLDAVAGLSVDLVELIFSESEVAGNKATGQVTSERRKKPFQLARGAIQNTPYATEPGLKTNEHGWFRHLVRGFCWRPIIPSGLPIRTFHEQII